MFKNIGIKIQVWAEAICWLGIIGSILAGVIKIIIGPDEVFITALLTIVLGSLASWIGSFITYGLGQLIISAEQIANNTSLIIQQNRAIQKNQKIIIANQTQTSEPNSEKNPIGTENPVTTQ